MAAGLKINTAKTNRLMFGQQADRIPDVFKQFLCGVRKRLSRQRDTSVDAQTNISIGHSARFILFYIDYPSSITGQYCNGGRALIPIGIPLYLTLLTIKCIPT